MPIQRQLYRELSPIKARLPTFLDTILFSVGVNECFKCRDRCRIRIFNSIVEFKTQCPVIQASGSIESGNSSWNRRGFVWRIPIHE